MLVAPLALIAVLTVVIVDMAPKSGVKSARIESQKPAAEAVAVTPPRIPPAQTRVAEAPTVRNVQTTPSYPTTELNARVVTPQSVPPISPPPPEPAEPQRTASLFDQPPQDITPGVGRTDEPATTSTIPQSSEDAAQRATPPVNLTGAFPTTTPTGAEAADGQDFAVYFDEAAPDEQEARTLLGEVQKKYGPQLSGGRLTYRRVRVGDATMYRVRMSGLSQARASELCATLKASGGGCEVGPR
ncbi:MAG: SPOR domain-containing protein [Beijerinckiaceae bacterium]|nr:SPOR domain-containing protein [Beijerinckiaceae bacterium]